MGICFKQKKNLNLELTLLTLQDTSLCEMEEL